MRKLFFLLLCIQFASNLQAQTQYPLRDTTITLDTINITGLVYDQYNKPVKGISVGYFPFKSDLKGFKFACKTDANGYFELKGVDPARAISIMGPKYMFNGFPIKGSRFLVIYLPSITARPVTWDRDSLIVKTKRVKPLIKPKFNVKTSDQKVFPVYEVQPSYPGGIEKFTKYLKQHLTYPVAAVNNNIEGTVEVSFFIAKDGSLTNFKILKGLGYNCDEVVIKCITEAGKWHPGMYMAEVMEVPLSVSVQFKLTDK